MHYLPRTCRQRWVAGALTPTKPVLQSLVMALVLSRLDYGSTVLFDLPQQLADKLHLFSTPLHDWWMLCCDCCPSSRPYLAHQPIAAGSSLAAGCWPYHISVGGTHLPLLSQFSTWVPVETTAARFWCSHTPTTSFFVVHCFGYFADLSRNHRR